MSAPACYTAPTRWRDLSPAEAAAHPQVLSALAGGHLDGVLIRAALDPAEAARLARHTCALPAAQATASPWGRVLTRPLIGSTPPAYFGGAQRTRRLLDGLAFPRDAWITAHLETLGGRAAQVPTLEGVPYCGGTVRIMEPGGQGIRSHVGSEFITTFPELRHLGSITRLDHQLSWFVLLQAPAAGGRLLLYDLRWEDTPAALIADRAFARRAAWRDDCLQQRGATAVPMQPGDLIVFDGGRIWHAVEPVEGPTPRVTLGGFAALSRDEGTTLFWS